jgi:hypothetical protein
MGETMFPSPMGPFFLVQVGGFESWFGEGLVGIGLPRGSTGRAGTPT